MHMNTHILIMCTCILYYITQSKTSVKAGMSDSARKQGMCAAYLSFAAIVVALIVACLYSNCTDSWIWLLPIPIAITVGIMVVDFGNNYVQC